MTAVIPVSHMGGFDVALAIAMGVGLAAATGFRVCVPMLVLSIGACTGHLTLTGGLAWLGTPVALAMLSVAAALEILAYYIPGVDNVLDVIATPAALIAGTVVSAAVMSELPPTVRWATAVIAGGGAAGAVQALTSLLRAKSTVMTAGLGNHLLSTAELGGALILSLLAIAAPLAAVLIVILLCWLIVRRLRRLSRKSGETAKDARAGSSDRLV